MLDYLPELLKGLHTSLTLTVASIIVKECKIGRAHV